MEEILIPMECLYDIPSLNHMMMPDYKAGDIFMFNPYHEVHVELQEHGVFKEIDNSKCDFICQYPDLFINGKYYNIGEQISTKDILSFNEETLKSLYYIGYIKKVIKEQSKNNNTKEKDKTIKAKKRSSETFVSIAKKLGKTTNALKKEIFEKLGIEVKDMRKKVPLKIKKKIMEL